jgi:thioesterase domain-containing protein
MPLFHIHGIVAGLLAPLQAGGSVICTPGFRQLLFLDWLDELEATWYSAVPTMHAAVVGRARDRTGRIARHRLRFVRSSSAPLPLSVLHGLEAAFDVPVIEAYGMTEAAHQIASNALHPGLRKPGTVGCAAGPEIRILDDSGRVLQSGEVGEVAIRGESVFLGYEANAEANSASFSGDWFRTGDQGFLDRDGFLTLTGRIKEMVNRGGEKVSPLEVDNALLLHEGVAEAVTFAMRDPRLGEEVAAAVVLEPGSEADERALQNFVAARLSPFKVPRRIVVLDELPTGPTGKLQRVGLAEQLLLPDASPSELEREPRRFLEWELVDIWESVLDVRGVGVADDFFVLGGDSLLAAEAVARIRNLIGDHDLPLVSIVRAPTPAAMAEEALSCAGIGLSGLVPLQRNGDRVPLFLVHPGDGEVLAYPVLARRLHPDQPSYGLRAQGIDDGSSPPTSFSEMASYYVTEIRQVQPTGPYLLGGYCIGGVIASEMASQLVDSGEEVAMLILMDPRFRRPPELRYRAWLAAHRAARKVRRATRIQHRVGRQARRAARVSDQGVAAGASSPFDLLRESHAPRPTAGPALVLVSEGFERFELPDRYLESMVEGPLAWRQFKCTHPQLLLPPNVDLVAREIGATLDRLEVSRRGQ